jgi:hypothetical protein
MKPWHIIGSMSKESIACVPNICGRSVSTKFLYPDFAKAPREYASLEEVPWLLSVRLSLPPSAV